jgi:photosystem II stability/assembly factor-like uncharacterized protein
MKIYFYLIILLLSLYSINISAQWFAQESETTESLYNIQFVDNNNGWCMDAIGSKLFHTTNGGAEWFLQKDFITSTIWNFQFINDSIGYINIHGLPGYLFKTTDGGLTWQTIYIFSASVDDLKFYDENIGWCVTNELSGSLAKTTNGGLNWEGFDYFISFNGVLGKLGIINANTIIVTALSFQSGSNLILKTTDGGITWIEIPVSDDLIGGRIEFINENIGWIESFGSLYKTTDGAFNWELQVASLSDFFFVDENTGWYIINNQINKTTDGGTTWVSQNSGTGNDLHGISFVDLNNGWVSGTNGTILYTPNGGLPVELTHFDASISSNVVTLNWQTASETNNKGFEVQRLQNCKNSRSQDWITIGFVAGYGTTTEKRSYSFTDENLSSGNYSYRLKQIDFDGTYKYSDIVEVEIAPIASSLSQNYPNPFNPTTSIQYSIASKQFVTLKIYDVLGNEVAALVNEEKPAGNYTVEFNGNNLASGIYFYQMKAGNFTATKKLILMK